MPGLEVYRRGSLSHRNYYKNDWEPMRLSNTVTQLATERTRSSSSGKNRGSRPLAEISILRGPSSRSKDRRGGKADLNALHAKALQEMQKQKWQYWLWRQKLIEKQRQTRRIWVSIIAFSLISPFLLFFVKQNSQDIRHFVQTKIELVVQRISKNK